MVCFHHLNWDKQEVCSVTRSLDFSLLDVFFCQTLRYSVHLYTHPRTGYHTHTTVLTDDTHTTKPITLISVMRR